jgi:hypothetical protein
MDYDLRFLCSTSESMRDLETKYEGIFPDTSSTIHLIQLLINTPDNCIILRSCHSISEDADDRLAYDCCSFPRGRNSCRTLGIEDLEGSWGQKELLRKSCG